MTARRHPFFTSARGRLLSFNLLMGVVTLLVSGVAVFGFHHASQLQEQVQRQTLNDMRGSMDLARDTANVATAAVRLSQVVGALEYKSEAERLLATQQALKHSLAPLSAQLEESDLTISWYMYHIKALVALLNEDINQYVTRVAEASEQRAAQSHRELRSISMFILLSALLALAITGCAGWYIYRNLGSNLTAISRAMSRLAQGEPNVSVPALQRRDELGELARAFNVFARNMASLEHTTRLLKEKTNQMEIDRIKRQELEEALLHSQKMKAVGQLTGGLAHDFNNLLAVIIGSLELVEPDARDAPRLSRALKAAERGALLTQRLLAFSRKQALHPQAVAMAPLLENLSELMRHSLPATLSLEIEAQSPAWPAWIDVGQLENALINLVMNARDAMAGRDGVIKIRTWNQRVTRSSGQRQDMVALEVIDHGSGMSQAVKARVFEPFFTTKATGSGSGLGLSMVYGFVRQSGGRVALESAPGQGTTVRLQLPRALTEVEKEVAPAVDEPPPAGERLALVLEDEEDVRQTLCEQLHQLGWLTLETASGEEALQLLEASPDIALLISDLMLPGALSGADVIHTARRRFPALPVLLISGQDLRPAQNPALPEVEWLRKPFTRAQLAQALSAAYARI
ncbi:hybrid sensor histidine kinase/response regulator [Klebsiella pneumoniae]|uniref:ATP-binding protein n=1 Tax=Klebsiella pneumoniae TaxID=573 RepID=UPI000D74C0B4|nr:ATP-binding protein [Klebsiella pneumoniae]MBE9320908.1 response regulator [Klebsiella pneumoniae]MBE9323052.1 response regulator [Klebsiella pneumoniae]PXG40515.1 hybrid sensor histidine kinase/response regulator [Klebsiella pneumoniae]PXG49352.1 hybrid sensor histidine kinase/response regulator [Klebsiella pneumoniae]